MLNLDPQTERPPEGHLHFPRPSSTPSILDFFFFFDCLAELFLCVCVYVIYVDQTVIYQSLMPKAYPEKKKSKVLCI